MTAPQNDPELIAKLAAMTSDEFAAVVTKARGSGSDDWRISFAAKTQQLRELMNNPTRG